MKLKFIPLVAILFATPAVAESGLLDFGKQALESINQSNIATKTPSGAGLSASRIATGLKDALRVGTQKAVATVGKPGGFLNNAEVHIPLPGPLEKVKQGLALVGMSDLADDLEIRINKAAEAAAPKAVTIFGHAVQKMTITDARGILTGPPDSATKYFRKTSTPELTAAMKPEIDKSLSQVGAVKSYNALAAEAKTLPLMSNVDLDLDNYVVNKTLDGIFHYLGKQEADIRANPAARTTEALKAVFK